MSLETTILLNGYNDNLKEIFGFILKHNIYNKLSYKNISDNIFFKEKYTDVLSICDFDDIGELIDKGYQEIQYENYVNSLVNSSIETKVIDDYTIKNFTNYLYVNDEKITFSFKDNVINFNGSSPYRLIKSIKFNFNIDDFIIDEDGFVYILTNSKLIKSHISLDFYKDYLDHECVTDIEDIEKIYIIELDNPTKILNIEDYYITYMSDKVIKRTELGRKYYFIKDEQVYFNIFDYSDKVTFQVEHTHFYDWISLLGLNKFNINGNKLSTKYTDKFLNIIKFPFDSTLNGMLNYSDFLDNKNYKIDKDIDYIKILGNFNYNYEKGKYKIILKANKSFNDREVMFHIDLLKDGECLKRMSGNTVNMIMYFCNLKFIFYKYEYNSNVEIDIEITDDYSIKLVKEIKDIEDTNISDFYELFKIDQFFRNKFDKHQLIETDFENGHFIIKNYIKSSKERAFTEDFKIKFIEKDGTPSMLWGQIKDKDYFLKLKNYLISKTIKPKRKEKSLLFTTTTDFKLNLSEYLTKEELRKNRRR